MPVSEEAALDRIIRRVAEAHARQIAASGGVNESIAEAKQAITQVQQSLSGSTIPKDDGTPPAAPANVVVTPGMRSLAVSWDLPPTRDYVDHTVVSVTNNQTGAVTTKNSPKAGVTFLDLAALQTPVPPATAQPYTYAVKARHVDMWEHWSAPTNAGSFSPLPSATDGIDLTKAQILGTLQGLLPNANLQTIQDATKLGSGVVTAQAMAVQNAAAMNLWVGNAAIQNAMIASLTADKLVAGTINTGQITVQSALEIAGGGSLYLPGAVSLDSTGLNLAQSASDTEPPSANGASKITPSVGSGGYDWGAFHFAATGAGGWRGPYVVGAGGADDGANGVDGIVSLTALPGRLSGYDAPPAARLVCQSKLGGFGLVEARGRFHVTGESLSSIFWSGSIGAGASLTLNYDTLLSNSHLAIKTHVMSYDGGSWVPVLSGTGFGIRCNSPNRNSFYVVNDNSSARSIQIAIDYGGA